MKLCSRRLRSRATRSLFGFVGTLFVCLAMCSTWAGPAQAFSLQGGTSAQRDYINQVISTCALPSWVTDAELRALGPVKVVIVDMQGVTGYSKMGTIFIDSDFMPGKNLGELVAHEWSHQIWYSLGPKWWQKWPELCDSAGVACPSSWVLDPAENFAECARLALFPSQYRVHDYPCTGLEAVDATMLCDWITVARYVNLCPFDDVGANAMPTSTAEDELAAAAGYVYAAGIMQGFTSDAFRPEATLTRGQLATICVRAGLSCPAAWRFSNYPATRRDVRDSVPGLAWTSGNWGDTITRGQVARLVWRAR